jgi:predicted transglutaminase-like cysteine proteinase
MRRGGFLAAGIMGLATALGAASPAPAASRMITASVPMEVIDSVKGPIGWIEFCQAGHASDCNVGDATPKAVSLSDAAWSDINRINRLVNATIDQVEDITLYGVQEKWTYPDQGKGDCEDLALLKRRMLMEAGMPRQALLMTVVRDETGAGHAVLTVVTDRGDYILDSKTSKVLPWRATGYGYIKRQSQVNPNLWVRLGEPGAPGMTVAGH